MQDDHPISRFPFTRTEAAGALGDLGTYIPLLVGMVSICGLQLAPTLLTSGAMNIITGIAFGIPMPVQPMKAIAAVAIDQGLTEPQILAAGIITGALLLLLATAGLVDLLARYIPKCVVRGIQFGLGLKLFAKGVLMIGDVPDLFAWDGLFLGLLAVLTVTLLTYSRRWPGALVVLALGFTVLLIKSPDLFTSIHLGMQWHLPDLTRASDWQVAGLRAAIPQIPLTLLNSVIAVCALSCDLFPSRPAQPRRVAASVGLMNLIACPLGGMPVCHGAGGLAAQYRFGARTGASVVMLGIAKIALALAFGGSLLALLQAFPRPVLGALLIFGALELALVCRDQTRREDFLVMFVTAGLCLAVNTAVGFAAGWLLYALVAAGWIRFEPGAAGRSTTHRRG